MAYDLRPLSLAELLDRAFTLYRRHFWIFVGIMAPPSLAMLIFQAASQFLQAMAARTPNQPRPEFMIAAAVGLVTGAILALLVYWIAYALALGATTLAVSEVYSGRTPSIAGAYSATRGKLGRLTWLTFLIGIRFFGVAFAVVVGGALSAMAMAFISPIFSGVVFVLTVALAMVACFWMLVRYAVSVPAAVLEENTASESITRSIYLTRGSLLRVIVLFVFTMIVTYAAFAIFQVPFLVAAMMAGPETTIGFWLNMLGVVTGSIASALTGPLAVVAMVVLYYDVRIRKEGLDLELLVAGLRQPAPAAGASSSAVLPG
jgi:hypothetical protein